MGAHCPMCSPTSFVWQCIPLAQGNFGLPRGRMLPMGMGWQGGLGKRKKGEAVVGFEPPLCAWCLGHKTNSSTLPNNRGKRSVLQQVIRFFPDYPHKKGSNLKKMLSRTGWARGSLCPLAQGWPIANPPQYQIVDLAQGPPWGARSTPLARWYPGYWCHS